MRSNHVTLIRRNPVGPTFVLPNDRGSITSSTMLAAETGPERDAMIHEWCAYVWAAFRDTQPIVAGLANPARGDSGKLKASRFMGLIGMLGLRQECTPMSRSRR